MQGCSWRIAAPRAPLHPQPAQGLGDPPRLTNTGADGRAGSRGVEPRDLASLPARLGSKARAVRLATASRQRSTGSVPDLASVPLGQQKKRSQAVGLQSPRLLSAVRYDLGGPWLARGGVAAGAHANLRGSLLASFVSLLAGVAPSILPARSLCRAAVANPSPDRPHIRGRLHFSVRAAISGSCMWGSPRWPRGAFWRRLASRTGAVAFGWPPCRATAIRRAFVWGTGFPAAAIASRQIRCCWARLGGAAMAGIYRGGATCEGLAQLARPC